MKIIYLIMTVVICSIFIGLFIAGWIEGTNLWFCFFPIGLVVRDFLKDYRTPFQEAATSQGRIPYPWPKSEPDPPPEKIELFTDFFIK